MVEIFNFSHRKLETKRFCENVSQGLQLLSICSKEHPVAGLIPEILACSRTSSNFFLMDDQTADEVILGQWLIRGRRCGSFSQQRGVPESLYWAQCVPTEDGQVCSSDLSNKYCDSLCHL